MGLKKAIGRLGLKLGGWKLVTQIPDDLKKAVIIVAPHTAVEDFFVGWAFFWAEGKHFKIMIKKEMFRFCLFRWVLNRLGCVPVDRGKRNNLVEQMTKVFDANDEVFLVICPEGTRKKVKRWKKGFHIIARGAQVPIIFGFENFKTRTCGYDTVFEPTDDFDADMKVIFDYYKDVTAKFPELYYSGQDEDGTTDNQAANNDDVDD